MVIEPCVVYKAIYNNTFLDKEFLHSWCMCTDDEGTMRSTGVSLARLWRPLCPQQYYIRLVNVTVWSRHIIRSRVCESFILKWNIKKELEAIY